MKKILIINDLTTGGGVENILQNLVKYLNERDYKITVFTSQYEKNFYSFYPPKVSYYHLFSIDHRKNRLLNFVNRVIRCAVKSFIHQKKFDVVIAIKEGWAMKFGSNCKASNKIAWVHVDYNYAYWTHCIFPSKNDEIECMRRYNYVVCVSNSTKESVINTIGNPGNLCVKYNPINVEQIIQKSKESTGYRRPENQLLFVSVGRLVDQKNFEMLLECVRKIGNKDKFELWIIGEGGNRNNLENMIKKYELDHVKLLGNQINPYPIMKQADWFISSAVWESFGLAIQESIILGVPVLTTRCPAVDEVFDKKAGIVVNNSETALSEKMLEIIENPDMGTKYKEYMSDIDFSDYFEMRFKSIEELWEN